MTPSRGWVQSSLATRAIEYLFNASTTVTISDGQKARFWHNSWLEGEAPEIWSLTCSNLLEEKTERSIKNFETTPGHASLGIKSPLLPTSKSSSLYGSESKMSSYSRVSVTPSSGNGRLMATTPPVQLTESSSTAPMEHSTTNTFGKPTWRTNAKFLLGYSLKKRS
jgi:hypothetical protein